VFELFRLIFFNILKIIIFINYFLTTKEKIFFEMYFVKIGYLSKTIKKIA
jgi:hypothetical protein